MNAGETPPAAGIVRGYRGIRELLGVSMDTVCALVGYDSGRERPILVRATRGNRASIRATAVDVWRLYREFQAAADAVQEPPRQ
jgi:hypothetical protein